MDTFWNTKAPINGWRIVNMVCWILLGVWLMAALPCITLTWGGFNGNVSRFVYMNGRLYGLELYRHIILTETMAEEYMNGVIISALPAVMVMNLEIFSMLRAKTHKAPSSQQ